MTSPFPYNKTTVEHILTSNNNKSIYMAKNKKTDAQVIIDALPLLDLSELLAVAKISAGLISEHEKKAKYDLELIQNGGK